MTIIKYHYLSLYIEFLSLLNFVRKVVADFIDKEVVISGFCQLVYIIC